jgi:hypothetical protein
VASRIDGRIDQFRTEKATRASTSSLTAYDLWLRAQHLLMAWTAEIEAEAEGLLLTALDHDPRLARAHSSLALQFNSRPLVSWLHKRDRRSAQSPPSCPPVGRLRPARSAEPSRHDVGGPVALRSQPRHATHADRP